MSLTTHSPKKTLGQNFLVNERVLEKIVAIAELGLDDIVVEVGPGRGALTELIAGRCKKLIAVEKDDQLAEELAKKYEGNGAVKIINGDILKFNPNELGLQPNNWKLVGNIPYYLTSHLIKIALDPSASGWPVPKLIVFTVQKEVAQRITARPPEMSLLAVAVQYFAKATIEAKISKGNFRPMPKVDSAVIKLAPLENQPSAEDSKKFFEIVRAGFAGKRKKIVNNLSSGLKLDKMKAESKLREAGIEPSRRPETLSVEEWQKISKIF